MNRFGDTDYLVFNFQNADVETFAALYADDTGWVDVGDAIIEIFAEDGEREKVKAEILALVEEIFS
jgi:hypothetical protein